MSGILRELATLQKDAGTGRTGFGARSESWEDVLQLMVGEEHVRGEELAIASQIVGGRTIRYKIRHQDGIKPGMRLIVNGRTVEIVWVQDLDRRRQWQHLWCKEIV